MHTHADRSPLTWPGGWTRTRPSQREVARFSRTRSKETPFGTQTYVDVVRMPEAIQRLMVEVNHLPGVSQVVLSTNAPVRLDDLKDRLIHRLRPRFNRDGVSRGVLED